jgi:hydrogenase maturation protease
VDAAVRSGVDAAAGRDGGSTRPVPVPVTRSRPLVIGYGNSLRRDDGIGWHVARLVAADPAAAGVDVIAAHQLTPELAYDLHRASGVVLVDAVAGCREPPGRCLVRRLGAGPTPVVPAQGTGPTSGTHARGGFSHHCAPETLAVLARELYGSVAPVTVVGVAVGSVDQGDTLTAQVASEVPTIVGLVIDLALGGSST